MNEVPLFSICIPCFNHAQYVGRTIQSVLEQDFDDFEIVVADNASTDGSREVVRSFNDPKVRLIENRYNIGFAPNLQQVTREAKGRFLNVLSSDDLMQRGTLWQFKRVIDDCGQDAHRLVLLSQAWEIDEHDQVRRYVTKKPGDLSPTRVTTPTSAEIAEQPEYEVFDGATVFADCMKHLNTAGVFCTTMYSRDLWKGVEGYNSTQLINPDMHFVVKVLRHNPKVIYINRPLYSYRKHQMGQNAQQVRSGALKFQIDQYSYLLHFDEEWLNGTGVSPNDQRQLFLNRDCLNRGLLALAAGNWVEASRHLCFAWATFPRVAVRQKKTWALTGLLLLGPVGCLIASLLRKIQVMYRHKPRTLLEVADLPRSPSAVTNRARRPLRI